MSAKELGGRTDRDAAGPAEVSHDGLIDDRGLLGALFENVPGLILAVGLDGRILFVNRAHLGTPVDQIVGHSLFEYPTSAADLQKLREAVARAAGGTPIDYETCLE